MTAQAERVMVCIERILTAHGATFGHVINIRSFLTDLGQLRAYADVRRGYFPADPPSSTTVEAPRLFMADALLEVEVMAVVPAGTAV